MPTSFVNDSIQRDREQDRLDNYKNGWRLLCDGKVIEHNSSRLGEWAERSIRSGFIVNIMRAFTDDWDYDAWGMTASQWLDHHCRRLGMPLSTNLEVVPPGVVYPLAPNFKG